MNQANSLTRFLESVDKITKNCQKDKLVNFIHELARLCPKQDQQEFFNLLKGSSDSADGVLVSDKKYIQKLQDNLLDCVDFYNNELDAQLNLETRENYDYNHNEEISKSNLEAIFVDSSGTLKWIRDSLNAVDECFNFGQYYKAFELCELLSSVKISLNGYLVDDLGYDDTISLWSLATYYQIDAVVLERFLNQCLYITYKSYKDEERFRQVFRLFELSNTSDLKLSLEDLKTYDGFDADEFEMFLSGFINYLSTIDTYLSRRIIDEAVVLTRQSDSVFEIARKKLNSNPNLMVDLLRKGLNKPDDYVHMLKVGIDAYNNIDKALREKIDIAVLTSEYAKTLEKYDLSDELYYRIFKSRPTVRNYLKLRFNCSDFHKYDEEISQAFDKAMAKKLNSTGHVDENFMLIALLDGRAELFFDNVKGLEVTDLPNYQSSIQYYGLIICMLMLTKATRDLPRLNALAEEVIHNVFNAKVSLVKDIPVGELYTKWLDNITVKTDNLEKLVLYVAEKLEKFCAQVLESNIRNLNVDVDIIQDAQAEFLSELNLSRLKSILSEKYPIKQIDPQALISAAMAGVAAGMRH